MNGPPPDHRFIQLAEQAMGRKDAEERVISALRGLGLKSSKSQLKRAGVVPTLEPRTTFAQLVTGTMTTGEVPGLDRMLYTWGRPYLDLALESDAEGMTTVVGGGPRSSPPMCSPGYQTNDVVSDMVDNAIIYRRDVADLSAFGRVGFRPCFRSYTAYLAACITAIDAFMNRQRWYALNEPSTALTDAQKAELRNVRLPLDQKLRRWTSVLAGGRTLDETRHPWLDYTGLREARNGYTHVNEPDARFELRPAAEALNRCRLGVGQLLIDLSTLLGHAPSPSMYRVRYASEARFISKPSGAA